MMPSFRLTNAAENDLIEIGRCTRERWGVAQYRRYLTRLDDLFHMLADNPDLGIAADDVQAGYRRCPEGSHVIFYRVVDAETVEVVRVLHEHMLPENHIEDE
jgi:toxin ParE1/3/4